VGATDVDRARTVLQIIDRLMAHGDRWKYTSKEYDQIAQGQAARPGQGAARARAGQAAPAAA